MFYVEVQPGIAVGILRLYKLRVRIQRIYVFRRGLVGGLAVNVDQLSVPVNCNKVVARLPGRTAGLREHYRGARYKQLFAAAGVLYVNRFGFSVDCHHGYESVGAGKETGCFCI